MFSLYIEKKDLIELIKKKQKDMLNKEVSLEQIEISGACKVRNTVLKNGSEISTINIEDDKICIKLGYHTK